MGLSISKLLSSLFGKKEMRILMVGLVCTAFPLSSSKQFPLLLFCMQIYPQLLWSHITRQRATSDIERLGCRW